MGGGKSIPTKDIFERSRKDVVSTEAMVICDCILSPPSLCFAFMLVFL